MHAEAGPLSFTEVDGVPVVFAEAPPPLTAALVFRVGRADESPATAGITHVVEHLALSTIGKAMYSYNGQVEPLFTVFHASGRPDELVEFLDRTCRALHDLPLDRFDHELRVLRTEAHSREGGGFIGMHMVNRYGAQGLGLLAFAENGLFRLAASDVADHAAAWFTTGNAALWVNGPVPEGLRLPLPSGSRRPYPYAPVIEPGLPASFRIAGAPVSASFNRARTVVGHAVDAVLGARLWATMRHSEGVSYSVQTWAEAPDATTVASVVWADAHPDYAAPAVSAFVRTFESLAADGPTAEELEEHVERGRRAWTDPMGLPGRLDRIARRLAAGEEPDDDTLLPRLEALDGEAVRAEAAAALETTLLLLPYDVPLESERFSQLRAFSEHRVTGTRYQPCDPELFDRPVRPSITVGSEGITYDHGEVAVTVYWRSCALVERYENGARVVIGDDALRVDVVPWQWRHGDRLVATVDGFVDPRVAVDVPGASSAPRRLRPRRLVRRTTAKTWALAALFAVAAMFAVSGVSLALAPEEPGDTAVGLFMLALFGAAAVLSGWELAARFVERRARQRAG